MLQQSQLHFCTEQIMAVLWSLTCAAVILSLLQENNLSNSVPHKGVARGGVKEAMDPPKFQKI